MAALIQTVINLVWSDRFHFNMYSIIFCRAIEGPMKLNTDHDTAVAMDIAGSRL